LDVSESDEAVQQIIEALVHLSADSLDMVAWSLADQMERLLKVRLAYRVKASQVTILHDLEGRRSENITIAALPSQSSLVCDGFSLESGFHHAETTSGTKFSFGV
jgi:hypothetical protein